jgi:hypothetical protein
VPTFQKAGQESEALRRLISREANRKQLRKLLRLKVDPKLPSSFAELLETLDQREQGTDGETS